MSKESTTPCRTQSVLRVSSCLATQWQIGKNYAEVTQWVHEKHFKRDGLSYGHVYSGSGEFANYFPGMTSGARSTVSPSKMLALPV